MYYACSVCWTEEKSRTVIAGTVICKECLAKLSKDQEQSLKGKLAEAIEKENDIYD